MGFKFDFLRSCVFCRSLPNVSIVEVGGRGVAVKAESYIGFGAKPVAVKEPFLLVGIIAGVENNIHSVCGSAGGIKVQHSCRRYCASDFVGFVGFNTHNFFLSDLFRS